MNAAVFRKVHAPLTVENVPHLRDVTTMLTCYQHADEATMLKMME